MWPETDKTDALLADVRAGSREAINRLMERHRAAVQRMIDLRLDRKIRRRVDVSDVVQDVLVEANRRLQDYLENPRLPFHLWLRHITRDRIIDAHRRHRVSARRSVDREQGLAVPGAGDRSTLDLVAQLCDQQLTPATAVARQELAARVAEVIAHMDEPDCEILIMRHYEQLSNQEAAQALGLSAPAAGMRYLRAVRRLRTLMGETPEPSPEEP